MLSSKTTSARKRFVRDLLLSEESCKWEDYSAGFEAIADLKSEALLDVLFNRLGAMLMLVLFLPVMGIIALALKVGGSIKGSVLYRGERIGLDCNPFTIYKFRTLHVNAEKVLEKATRTPLDSPYATKLGRFLRTTKLDELPQLFNVVRGDMNFVGPRPVRKVVVDECLSENPLFLKRFLVKPGMTSAGALFAPHYTSRKIQFKLDMAYLRRRRLQADLIIIFATAATVLRKLKKYLYATPRVLFSGMGKRKRSKTLSKSSSGIYLKGAVNLRGLNGQAEPKSRLIRITSNDDLILPQIWMISDRPLEVSQDIVVNFSRRIWRSPFLRRTVSTEFQGVVETCELLSARKAGNEFLFSIRLYELLSCQIYYLERYFS